MDLGKLLHISTFLRFPLGNMRVNSLAHTWNPSYSQKYKVKPGRKVHLK